MKLRYLVVALVAAASLLLAACSDEDPKSAGDGVREVTRQVLGASASDRAPGQELGLSRVVVPAGKEIASHTHPGTQMAFIAEGTLTYTVLSGEVTVTRDAAGANPSKERVAAGTTAFIRPGDSLVEAPGMVHQARNNGKTPVVIFLSSLFEAGAPASSPATAR